MFDTVQEAGVVTKNRRIHYNTVRPHNSPGYRPPAPEAFYPVQLANAWPDHGLSIGASSGGRSDDRIGARIRIYVVAVHLTLLTCRLRLKEYGVRDCTLCASYFDLADEGCYFIRRDRDRDRESTLVVDDFSAREACLASTTLAAGEFR